MKLRSDIYLIGIGLYELRHLTFEAGEVLRCVNRVYSLSSRGPLLRDFNKELRDLNGMYSAKSEGGDTCDYIVRHLIEEARRHHPIAVVFDGNPMFYNDISWNLIAHAKHGDLLIESLPGVSCIDVLPIQLGFEPGDIGMQVYDANQMFLYRLIPNPYLSTLVLQVGFYGQSSLIWSTKRKGTYVPLSRLLEQAFPSTHPAVLIQSASSSTDESIVLTTQIAQLDSVRNRILPGMTLYIPRLGLPEISYESRSQFSLDPSGG